jgi:hypothetical protein
LIRLASVAQLVEMRRIRFSKPIQAHSPQRRARHKRRYDSALLGSSRSHEETLNLSIENNDFTVTFDTRLPITGAQEHLAMEYTHTI